MHQSDTNTRHQELRGGPHQQRCLLLRCHLRSRSALPTEETCLAETDERGCPGAGVFSLHEHSIPRQNFQTRYVFADKLSDLPSKVANFWSQPEIVGVKIRHLRGCMGPLFSLVAPVVQLFAVRSDSVNLFDRQHRQLLCVLAPRRLPWHLLPCSQRWP